MDIKDKYHVRFNLSLLVLVFIYIFIVGLLPAGEYMNELYNLIFTAIYMVAAKIISHNKSKKFFVYAGIVIVAMWVSAIFDLDLISILSSFISIIFIVVIIALMLIRLAKSKEVGLLEFVEAINIYFLIGIVASILFRIVFNYLPGESFNISSELINPNIDLIYFSFITLSTLGYGDITPIDPIAKSLSIFVSISGQLYLTMIIAILVGKYLNKHNNK